MPSSPHPAAHSSYHLHLVQVDQGAQEDHAHTSPSPSPTPAASDSERSAAQSASLSHDNVLTTPAVRRIARENSIDLRTVVGTGRDGRVLKEDVLKLVEGKWSVRSPYMLACELRYSSSFNMAYGYHTLAAHTECLTNSSSFAHTTLHVDHT